MISNILTYAAIIFICFIVLCRWISSSRKKSVISDIERKHMEEQERLRRIQAEELRHQEERKAQQAQKKEPDPEPVITFPSKVDHFNRAYFYPDVKIIPVPDGASHVVIGEPLTFIDNEDSVQINQGDFCIGHMEDTRHARMVRDWINSGEPILAYVGKYADDGSYAEIGLAFYQDKLAKFLARNPDAKTYKLAGKPEEYYIGVSEGEICTVDHDYENDRYNVLADGIIIGRLPAAALTFAEKNECDPEDLTVYVASVEYDVDKDRDIISVYLDD